VIRSIWASLDQDDLWYQQHYQVMRFKNICDTAVHYINLNVPFFTQLSQWRSASRPWDNKASLLLLEPRLSFTSKDNSSIYLLHQTGSPTFMLPALRPYLQSRLRLLCQIVTILHSASSRLLVLPRVDLDRKTNAL
jgi:hypothetical protein